MRQHAILLPCAGKPIICVSQEAACVDGGRLLRTEALRRKISGVIAQHSHIDQKHVQLDAYINLPVSLSYTALGGLRNINFDHFVNSEHGH
jgi:hypothetical protein